MKRRNYYNLLIYALKFFLVMNYLTALLAILGDLNIVPFLKENEGALWIIYLIFGGLLIISASLISKYSKKITVPLIKPKDPRSYNAENIEQIDINIQKQLKNKNYDLIDILQDAKLYGVEVTKWYYGGDSKYQLRLFVQYTYEEFNKEIKKYLEDQENLIQEKLAKKRRYINIVFLVKVKHQNNYTKKYLRKPAKQAFDNCVLTAILVEEEKKLYIPYTEWKDLDYYLMRKRLEKILSGHIKKIKKLR